MTLGGVTKVKNQQKRKRKHAIRRSRERKDARDGVFDGCLNTINTQVRKQTPEAKNRSLNFRITSACAPLFFGEYKLFLHQLIGLLRVKRTLSRFSFIFWSMIYDHDWSI
jgi:hypothetical protein